MGNIQSEMWENTASAGVLEVFGQLVDIHWFMEDGIEVSSTEYLCTPQIIQTISSSVIFYCMGQRLQSSQYERSGPNQ